MMQRNPLNAENHDSINLSNFMHELSKAKGYHDHDNHDDWFTVDKLHYEKIILESYGDSDKRRILEVTTDTSRNMSEIFDICNKPQTSVYRKVMSLIECGLLIPDGFSFNQGKKSKKYKSIIEKLQINIIGNKISIKVKPTMQPNPEESFLLQTLSDPTKQESNDLASYQ
jgi:hypothetical protein